MQPRTEPGDGKMPMGCRDRPFSVAVSYPPCTIEGIKMVKYGGNLLPGAGPCVLPAETPCGSLPVFGEFGMPTTGGHMGPPLQWDTKRCMIASGGCVVCLHGAVEKEMELFV